MSPKVAIPIVLGALAFVPAALVAQHNQLRLRAFATEGAPLSQAVHVATANRPPLSQTIELPPVSIGAVRHVRAVGLTDGQPTACASWRKLQAGPDTRASTLPMVRWCEGPDLLAASEPPPATAQIPAPPRPPPPPHETWQFKVHVGGPR